MLLRGSAPGDATDAEIEFGSSEYAKEILDALWGFPPALELEKEAALIKFLIEVIQARLVDSVHDCSEGGLAVALSESCFQKSVGASVRLASGDLPIECVLFGEDASRVVLSCDPKQVKRIQQLAVQHGISTEVIGENYGEDAGDICRWQKRGVRPCCGIARGLRGCAGECAAFGPGGDGGGLAMPTNDKFRDECGVVAIHNHPEAEKLAYLGLHALQHRGQESAGIASSDGIMLRLHKAMGLVADIFTPSALAGLHGIHAIGHTRYSTAGDSALLNAQPIMVQSNKGMIALAHNGNLVNAGVLRRRLEAQGSIFQTTSDTEVMVHLLALSREKTLPEALADSLRRVEGAFSLVMVTPTHIFAARDPRGFRPLAMGRIPAAPGQIGDTTVFASETCAFDLIGAEYVREVKAGEMVVVGPDGIFVALLFSGPRAIELHL